MGTGKVRPRRWPYRRRGLRVLLTRLGGRRKALDELRPSAATRRATAVQLQAMRGDAKLPSLRTSSLTDGNVYS